MFANPWLRRSITKARAKNLPFISARAKRTARPPRLELLEDRLAPALNPVGVVNLPWINGTYPVLEGEWKVALANVTGTVGKQTGFVADRLAELSPEYGVLNHLGADGQFLIQAPANRDAHVILAELNTVLSVAVLEPNFVITTQAIPNDPFFGQQWALEAGAQMGPGMPGAGDPDVDAPESWDVVTGSFGGTGVIVATFDTGVDYTHPDLINNLFVNQAELPASTGLVDADGDGIISFRDLNHSANAGKVVDFDANGQIDGADVLRPSTQGGLLDGTDGDGNGQIDDLLGWNFVDDDHDTNDQDGHGTNVAGIIGAQGNNALGIAGVSWDVQILPLRIFASPGGNTGDAAVVAAMNYLKVLKDAGANVGVANLSWGGGGPSFMTYQGIKGHQDAPNSTLFVAAAGNGGANTDAAPYYPAGYHLATDFGAPHGMQPGLDNLLAVGASTNFDNRATSSNYGANSVHLFAPGDNVITTNLAGTYAWVDGTSVAAPHVAGAAALGWALASPYSYQQITSAILTGVDAQPSYAGQATTGGRLSIDGILDNLDMIVAGTTPADGSSVTTPPAIYQVDFAFPFSQFPGDVDLSRFLVNGVQPVSTTVVDANTLELNFASNPVTTPGTQSFEVLAGAVKRQSNGDLSTAFAGSFVYQGAPLDVVATNPAMTGGIFTLPGPLTFDVDFNLAVDPLSVQITDLVLSGISGATVTGVTVFPGNTTVRFTLNGMTSEGTLTASIPAGAISDAAGFPNQAFAADYLVDIGTVPYPSLVPVGPLGSLIYDPTFNGDINPAGDADNFTLAIDPAQVISMLVIPSVAGLRPRVELRDPSNVLIGSADAAANGQRALLNTVATTTGGTYTFTVRGLANTTGTYTLQVNLNAAFEVEGNVTGAANDTIATAQNIDGSFTTVQTALASATRGGVIGGNPDGPTLPVTLTFESGAQGFTANGLWHLSTRRGNDPNHSPVTSFYYGNEATGNYNTGGTNSGSIISPSFVVPANFQMTFKYFLQTENFPPFDAARVQVSTNGGASWTNVLGPLPDSLSFANASANLSTFVGQTVLVRFFFDTLDGLFNAFEGWYVDDVVMPAPSPWSDYYAFTVGANEAVSVALTRLSGDVVNVFLENSGGTVLASGVAGATNFDRGINDFVIAAPGTYYVRTTATLAATYSFVVTRGTSFDTEPNDSFGTAQNINATRRALGAITGTNPAGDWYSFNVAAVGGVLRLDSATPADGPGEIINTLNPLLELYNPSGALVATGTPAADGRNEFILHEITAAGNYRVRVVGEGGTVGEYFISQFVAGIDFGDAPASFGTVFADNGARHVDLGPRLGALRDTEVNGFPSASGTGDNLDNTNDEDGLVSLSTMVPGGFTRLAVSASGASRLDAWIDFNQNGVFEASDRVTPAAGTPVVAGANNFDFIVPLSALQGGTYVRLRLSTAGGLSPNGLAGDGEVEDYTATVNPSPIVVYVDDSWIGVAPGTLVDGDAILAGFQDAIVGIDAYTTLAQAIAVVGAPGTVFVNPGSYSGAGNRELVIDKALIIDGTSSVRTDADVNAAGGAFGFSISLGGIVIRDLTIRGSNGDGIAGSYDGSLTITNVQSTGHGGRGLSVSGGAASTLDVSASVFSNNLSDGIGSFVGGPVALTNVTGSGNGGKGATVTGASSVTVTASTFNNGQGGGWAISNVAGYVALDQVNGNDGVTGDGLAIDGVGGSVTVTGSSFNGNVVGVRIGNVASTVTLTNVLMNNNDQDGLQATAIGPLTVFGSSANGNLNHGFNLRFADSGSVTAYLVTASNNSWAGFNLWDGTPPAGAVASIGNSTFSNNAIGINVDGASSDASSSTVTIEAATISANTKTGFTSSKGNGGIGVNAEGGTVIVTGSALSGNLTGAQSSSSDVYLQVTQTNLTGNSVNGVANIGGNPTVDAGFNYWGSTTGPQHATNPGGTGNRATNGVRFFPWSITAGGTTFATAPKLLSNGILVVVGRASADSITVTPVGSMTQVTINGQQYGFATSGITDHVAIFSLGGNDTITVNANLETEVHAGDGNDVVNGGSARDVVFGGGGADVLNGNGGNDALVGELGMDQLFGNGGDDLLFGGVFKKGLRHGGSTAYDYATLRSISLAWVAGSIDADLNAGITDDQTDTETDQMTGGAGRDWFLGLPADVINDFLAGTDKLTNS